MQQAIASMSCRQQLCFRGSLMVQKVSCRSVASNVAVALPDRRLVQRMRLFTNTAGCCHCHCCCLQVIPGWEQGILGNDYIPPIKEGGARTLLIPPELAYGSTGDGCLFGLPDSCRIPPNSPVIVTFKYRGLGY